jgi:sarcosine oxidase subunit alpha
MKIPEDLKKAGQDMNRGLRKTFQGVERGRPFDIEVDGEKIIAYEGETIGAALLAAGRRTLRYTNKHAQPRGIYCGIGLCQECRMKINGVPNVQACQTPATPGCKVETLKSPE